MSKNLLPKVATIFTAIFAITTTTLSYQAMTTPLTSHAKTDEAINSQKDLITYLAHHRNVNDISKTGQDVSTEVEILKEQAKSIEGKMNILVLGVDARKDDLSGRSDAMLVASLDKNKKTMNILSIPRDSYVPIIGKNMNDKITHAYAYGGIDTAEATVENLLDIKIDHYVVFNFTSFLKIIDKLGGIEIDSPYEFTEQDSKGHNNAIHIKKGIQTLNGEQALAYARMRHQDPTGDVGRGKRQQQVIEAVLNKLMTFDSISNFMDIYKTVNNSVNTDITLFKLTTMIPYVQDYDANTYSLDGSGFRGSNNIWYMKVNQSSLKNIKDIFHKQDE